MNIREAQENMTRLDHLEATITTEERKCVLMIRAYEETLDETLKAARNERGVLLRELERFLRSRDQQGKGPRWTCAVGELRLTKRGSWNLEQGKRQTAQQLLDKGIHQALKLAVKLSTLSGLSQEIREDLGITRSSRTSFSYKLRRRP